MFLPRQVCKQAMTLPFSRGGVRGTVNGWYAFPPQKSEPDFAVEADVEQMPTLVFVWL
jgi:hypothetical protein